MLALRPLSPELSAAAREQLYEVESRIPEDIRALREWIEKQPHLRARTDDQFLIAFLRFCKYSLADAKKRIDFYYTYKSSAKEDLAKSRRVDDKMLAICTSGIFATLPKPQGPGGPRIHFTRMGKINTSLFTIQDIFRFHMLRSEIEINTDDNWIISGVLEIVDFSKIPFSLIKQYDSNLFKRMAAFLEYGVPTNLRATHIVNASMEAQLMLTLVRTVMKQKELLHIHSNLESLHQAIGKEYLPTEYGGNNGSLDEAMTNFEQQLLSYRDYFVEDEQYGVDEKLRPSEKAEGTQAVASPVSGTFRKLTID